MSNLGVNIFGVALLPSGSMIDCLWKKFTLSHQIDVIELPTVFILNALCIVLTVISIRFVDTLTIIILPCTDALACDVCHNEQAILVIF
jgi:hypothetical protein